MQRKGRPPSGTPNKRAITMTLDPDLIEWIDSQSMYRSEFVNEILRREKETQPMKLNRDSLMSKIRLIQDNYGKRFHRSSASSYTSFSIPGGIVVSARKDGAISVDVNGSKTEFQSPDAAADYIEQAETVE